MGRRRYSGYQGRSTATDVLKIVLCVLVVLLVLAMAGLMLGQRYIVYTDDGVRLELPFFRREQVSSPDRSVPVDVVQLPGMPKPRPEGTPVDETAQTSVDSTEGTGSTELPDDVAAG